MEQLKTPTSQATMPNIILQWAEQYTLNKKVLWKTPDPQIIMVMRAEQSISLKMEL